MMSLKEIFDRIENEEKRILQLNNKIYNSSYRPERVYNVTDTSPENVYFDDLEDCYFQLINETEELLSEKILELKEVTDSLNMVNNPSKIFKFSVDKILGYNQVNELYFKNGRKQLIQTKEGAYYQYQIARETERLNLKDYIKPKPTFYKLEVEFFVNYEQKDVDGLKTFIDCLFRSLGDRKTFDDSQIVDIELFKTNVRKINENKKEFILVKFIEMNDYSRKNRSMYSEYISQKLKEI